MMKKLSILFVTVVIGISVFGETTHAAYLGSCPSASAQSLCIYVGTQMSGGIATFTITSNIANEQPAGTLTYCPQTSFSVSGATGWSKTNHCTTPAGNTTSGGGDTSVALSGAGYIDGDAISFSVPYVGTPSKVCATVSWNSLVFSDSGSALVCAKPNESAIPVSIQNTCTGFPPATQTVTIYQGETDPAGVNIIRDGNSIANPVTYSPYTDYPPTAPAHEYKVQQNSNSATYAETVEGNCNAVISITQKKSTGESITGGSWTIQPENLVNQVVNAVHPNSSGSNYTLTLNGYPAGCASASITNDLGGGSALFMYPSTAHNFTITYTCSAPVQAPIVDLKLDGSDVGATYNSGGSGTLSWTTTNAPDTCTASASPANGNWSGAKSVSGSSQSTGALTQTTTFTITCSNAGGSATDSVTATINVLPPPPATPTLTVTPAACGTATINLSWNSVAGATSYQLYRNGTLIYNNTGTSFSDTGLTPGQTYQYTIQSTNSGASPTTLGQSGNYAGTAPSACAGLPAPVPFTATPGACGTGAITLNWGSSVGANGYKLFRNSGLIYFSTGLSTTDSGLNPGQTYTYDVYATNGVINSSTLTLTATAPANCAGQPDLTAVITSAPTVNAGSPTTFVGSVTNGGTASTGFGFNNLFQVNSSPSGVGATTVSVNTILNPIGVSASASVNSSQYTPSTGGTFYVRLCADNDSTFTGTITELNEGNNCSGWTAFTVNAAIPTVTLSALPTSVPLGGGNTTLSWSSTNTTSCTASNNTGNASWNGSKAVSGSQSNVFVSITTQFDLSCTGPGGTVGASVVVSTAVGQPDLTAGLPTPSTASVGTPLTFTSTISNSGNASTGSSFSNRFQVANQPNGAGTISVISANTLSALNSGSSAPVTSSSYTFNSAGTYSVQVCADHDASGVTSISESNEGNNCSGWTNVVVTSVPTTPTGLTATPSTCGTGTINVTWNAVSGATSYTLRDGASVIYTNSGTSFSHTGLVAGSSHSYTVLATNGAGSSAYSGAVAGVAPSGCAQPDLTAGAPSPSTATTGVSLTFTSTISNVGGASTGSSFNNLFQVATASNGGGSISTLSVNSLSTLGASASAPVTSSSYTFGSAGTYSVRTCADADASFVSTVGESNEGNNCSGWTNVVVSDPVSPSGTITATDCVIALNASTCNSSVTWTTANLTAAPTEVTRNNPDFTHVSWATSGTNVSNAVNFGQSAYYLYHNGVALAASSIINATCANGTSWNGTICAANPVPVVTLTASPTSGTVNVVNPQLSWSATNAPTSCTASGDWSGAKAVSGTNVSQGVLSVVKTYTYTLTCSNASGAGAPVSATVVVNAASGPDLTVTVNPTPTTATAGVGQTYSATIKNIGTASTGSSFNNFFRTSTGPNGTGVVSSISVNSLARLAANASGVVTSSSYSFAAAGTYYVQVCADNNASMVGTISESNEGNNCSSWVTVTVSAPLPVPVVTLTASPTSGTVNVVNPQLSWSATNAPTSCTASGDWSGAKAVSGTNVSQGVLSVVKTYTYTLTCSNASGAGTPVSATVVVSAAPAPDLTAGITSPTTATAGSPLSFSGTVSNIGTASTGAGFNNFFQVATASNGGGTISDLTSSGMAILANGGSDSASSPNYTFPSSGTYSVRLCADKTSSAGGGVITESDETNNCGSWTDVSVAAAPVAFNYSLANSGDITVTKTSGTVNVQNTITETLLAGATQPVTISASGAPTGVSLSYSGNPCNPTCGTPTVQFDVSPSATTGTFLITVTGTSAGTPDKTTTFNLTINPSASYIGTMSVTPTSAYIGQQVIWTCSVSGGTAPYTYTWTGTDFPSNPTGSSVSVTYQSVGVKTASASVRDALGSVTNCASKTVQININPNFKEF